jgi:hypothetical protein
MAPVVKAGCVACTRRACSPSAPSPTRNRPSARSVSARCPLTVMRRSLTADRCRSRGLTFACVHGTRRNPEILLKTAAVQDPGAAMLAVHHPVDGPHGASSTKPG